MGEPSMSLPIVRLGASAGNASQRLRLPKQGEELRDWLLIRPCHRPMEGGRLVLRPFPTTVTRRLCGKESGLRVAPWPTCWALHAGSRG